MLKFNAVLVASGIDPTETRLLRHRDPVYKRYIYEDALRRNHRFEEYQAYQVNPRAIDILRSAKVFASFVVDPRGETLFVGLWRLNATSTGHAQDPYRDPGQEAKEPCTIFNLTRMTELDSYAGRIIIDWGGGERAWVQYAHRQDKAILELRQKVFEEPFPGFARFSCKLNEVAGLPSSWQEPLRGTRGVYLIIERDSGLQYVGAAVGSEGFLGRWRHYADGHGGNVGMRELSSNAEDYEVSILETVGSAQDDDDIYAIESLWKRKLGSRVKGLNRN